MADTIVRYDMPVVCVECKRTYAHYTCHEPDRVSHGICPECVPVVEERWFGNEAVTRAKEASHA